MLTTVETRAVSDIEAIRGVAFAVKWLLAQMPLVLSAIFDRISSRKTRGWHRLFKDQRRRHPSSTQKRSVSTLTRYESHL